MRLYSYSLQIEGSFITILVSPPYQDKSPLGLEQPQKTTFFLLLKLLPKQPLFLLFKAKFKMEDRPLLPPSFFQIPLCINKDTERLIDLLS